MHSLQKGFCTGVKTKRGCVFIRRRRLQPHWQNNTPAFLHRDLRSHSNVAIQLQTCVQTPIKIVIRQKKCSILSIPAFQFKTDCWEGKTQTVFGFLPAAWLQGHLSAGLGEWKKRKKVYMGSWSSNNVSRTKLTQNNNRNVRRWLRSTGWWDGDQVERSQDLLLFHHH